eukprot:CAMPEP_0116964212 /NCGR_PEP_ID=MMETSP0467-20121206/48412_1 /TAXON_ID=283647 /ORGANISM="Mesodinium pulex, Strain SPMC105" /LENGTH=81 /DNA_ID=CAMNT_0004653069 /DNA_START=10 /DNA_END=250 /DNA_ORIENTATION=-
MSGAPAANAGLAAWSDEVSTPAARPAAARSSRREVAVAAGGVTKALDAAHAAAEAEDEGALAGGADRGHLVENLRARTGAA